MRQRDYFLKRARKTNRPEDWANYRCFRNRVSNSIKKAEGAYNDHKAFWRTMKKILPGKTKTVSTKIKVGETLSSDKKCKANAFNKFFTYAATRLLHAIRSTSGSTQVSRKPSTRVYPAFRFEEVSQSFVKTQLKGLKAGKATGLDNIPARLLIDSAEIIAAPITLLINISLTSGQVPAEWKAARVVPLFKSGKVVDMDNYRPISILPVLSKVLERAVHKQLYHYLQLHKILSPYQYGFRKNNSTEFAALSFAETIRRNMDQGCLTGAAFIDLRKAFDVVRHG